MLSLTDNQKATLSIEILGMAVEAYLSQKANFFSDTFVEKGLEILSYALDGSPSLDITTPEEVLLAQAGAMISMATSCSSLGIGSLLSLSIYSRYKINKSLTSSILLPFALEDAAKFKTAKLDTIAHLFRIVDNYYFQDISDLDELDVRLKTFKEVKIDDIYKFAKKVDVATTFVLEGEENE